MYSSHRATSTLATTLSPTIQTRLVRRGAPSTSRTTERKSWRSRSLMRRRSKGSQCLKLTLMKLRTAKLRSGRGRIREGTSSVSDHQRSVTWKWSWGYTIAVVVKMTTAMKGLARRIKWSWKEEVWRDFSDWKVPQRHYCYLELILVLSDTTTTRMSWVLAA